MLLFCVGIVHTNLYNCISWVPTRILYLALFDIASHACSWRQEGHLVVKMLLQYYSLTLLERECYEGEVQWWFNVPTQAPFRYDDSHIYDIKDYGSHDLFLSLDNCIPYAFYLCYPVYSFVDFNKFIFGGGGGIDHEHCCCWPSSTILIY